MMKKILIFLALFSVLLLSILFSTSCKDQAEMNFNMKTDSILKIQFNDYIDSLFVPALKGERYNPVSIRKSGDTLFVANRADNADGVFIIQASTGVLIKKLTNWNYNGSTEVFDKNVIDVEVTPEWILVVNRSSRIDIFNRKDYSYITTIGTSQYWTSTMLQCESARVAGDKLFVRDKNSIKVFLLKDCIPANRGKVPLFASSKDSTTSNNGFQIQTVAVNKNRVYVTDYESFKIFVINPENVKAGQPIPFERSIRLNVRPLSLDFYKNDMYVTCADKSIMRINPQNGELIRQYKSFAGGISWADPGRICFDQDNFYICSRYNSAPALRLANMMYVQITNVD